MQLPKQGVIGDEFRYCDHYASMSAMSLAVLGERGVKGTRETVIHPVDWDVHVLTETSA